MGRSIQFCGKCGKIDQISENGCCKCGADYWIENEDLSNPELKYYIKFALKDLHMELFELKNLIAKDVAGGVFNISQLDTFIFHENANFTYFAGEHDLWADGGDYDFGLVLVSC